jgi:hypothetical protein
VDFPILVKFTALDVMTNHIYDISPRLFCVGEMCVFSVRYVTVEEIVECLKVRNEISTRNSKRGGLCDVRYNGLQECCDDSEKSESACCVKRMSHA